MSKKVYVGMSGGVDSSVTAALLKAQGYDVTGVYMKNWSQDLPGFVCPWKEDYQDAKRVAVQLDIPFKMYDFEKEYRHKVVDYMIDEYKAGRTPNPDVMCNQEVKFKLFLETALEDGADLIATGHYARILRGPTAHTPDGKNGKSGEAARDDSVGQPEVTTKAELWVGLDKNKDQSYFLYRVTEDALAHSLMPIGEYQKPQVRELAKKFGLATAEKKDSQGICFVGKVGIREFLEQFVVVEPGAIVDRTGKAIGEHDGALFYTIGQRHGLDVGGGLPYYVIGKDMAKNEVYVTTDLQDEKLWAKQLTLASMHWINGEPDLGHSTHQGGLAGARTLDHSDLKVRTRYRAALVPVKNLTQKPDGTWCLDLGEEVRALTPGQSAVLYAGDRVLGGGIVC